MVKSVGVRSLARIILILVLASACGHGALPLSSKISGFVGSQNFASSLQTVELYRRTISLENRSNITYMT